MAKAILLALVCLCVYAQPRTNVILAASRTGTVEFIDPATLETRGRIMIDLPRRSAGLNGVSADADGFTVYVDGPMHNNGGCCSIFAIDLRSSLKLVDRGPYYLRPRREPAIGVALSHTFETAGCAEQAHQASVITRDRIFVYETFGFTIDRRDRCPNVPGGAILLDRGTSLFRDRIAPDLYFAELFANEAGTELYGLTNSTPMWRGPVKLVRIDAHEGRVVASRELRSDFWRIATAALYIVPQTDLRAVW